MATQELQSAKANLQGVSPVCMMHTLAQPPSKQLVTQLPSQHQHAVHLRQVQLVLCAGSVSTALNSTGPHATAVSASTP